jgi:hypothetical protein
LQNLIFGTHKYALLALIEDAPVALKVATVVCGAGTLFVLETEQWFRQQQKHAFAITTGILVVIYLGFVAYAINHARQEIAIDQNLDQIYGASNPLQDRPFAGGMSATEQKEWENQIVIWRDTTAVYLQDNLGSFAHDRFINTRGSISLNYGSASQEVNLQINLLTWLRKNLETIIDVRTRTKK